MLLPGGAVSWRWFLFAAAGEGLLATGDAAEFPLLEDAEGPLDGIIEGGLTGGEAEGGGGFFGGFEFEGVVAGGGWGVVAVVPLWALAGEDVDVALFEPGEDLIGVFEMGAPVIPIVVAEVLDTVAGGHGVQGFDFEPVFVEVHVKS